MESKRIDNRIRYTRNLVLQYTVRIKIHKMNAAAFSLPAGIISPYTKYKQ